jgi:hypothetical protein
MPHKRVMAGDVPAWLEHGTAERSGGSVVERMIALPRGCPETTAWLQARGLGPGDYHQLAEVYDAARDSGASPEKALDRALRECRT